MLLSRVWRRCVSHNTTDKDTKLKELQAKNRWEREKYVEEQGWATMPFEKDPDSNVSELCVEQILNGH
jgi:hypothetical protein